MLNKEVIVIKNKMHLAVIFVVVLMILTAITIYSRYVKVISRTWTILTADTSFCENNDISSFRECLLRSDSQQSLSAALGVIDNRTNSVNYDNVEPEVTYIPKTIFTNITNKTNTDSIVSATFNNFSYVVENMARIIWCFILNVGVSYWTMSPSNFSSGWLLSSVFYINPTGGVSSSNTGVSYGVRPVINLNKNVSYSDGKGTEDEPYIITVTTP